MTNKNIKDEKLKDVHGGSMDVKNGNIMYTNIAHESGDDHIHAPHTSAYEVVNDKSLKDVNGGIRIRGTIDDDNEEPLHTSQDLNDGAYYNVKVDDFNLGGTDR